MKIFFSFTAALLLLISAQAQNDPSEQKALLQSADDGQPVAGALITVLHSNIKTISLANGSFSVNCRAGDTLLVTHLSFTARLIAVTHNNTLPGIITLQPLIRQMDEVQVNTGYQALPKERVTGSFEKIDNALFNQQVSVSVLSRLETIANGLTFDKKTSQVSTGILIRGLSTIRGPKSPLIILDNFPYEGDLSLINPNDVESITLLKDAAAASIWGTRAGNGVIVITTKKAKLDQPLRVEFNNNITITQKPGLFYYSNITPSDFIDVEQFLYSKGFFNNSIASSSKPVLSPVVELLIKKANGSIPAAEVDARINAMRNQDIRNEFNRYMYREAINEQHALTLRGGTDNIAYLFSAGYDNNRGSLDDRYRRMNLTAENTFRLNSRLQLMAGITYTQSYTADGKISYTNISTANGRLPMYTLLADASGNPVPVMKQYRQPYLDTAGAGKLLDWNYYPLDEHTHISNINRISAFTLNTGLSYKMIKSLSVNINYRFQKQAADNSVIYDEESFFARNMVNSFSQLNRATGIVTYPVPKGGINTSANSVLLVHNIRGQLSYAHKWNKHGINMIAGGEIKQALSTGSSFTVYGYNKNILTSGNVDYANPYPNFVTGFSSFISNGIVLNEKLNRFVSVYANAAYTFNDKYNLTLSGRRDASNLFGVHTNNKWTPLWSSGIGWELSKEQFYHFRPVSFLKFRATYGFSGNADPANTAVSIISYQGNSAYTLSPMARIDQFANPGLRWEKVAMFNIGFDFRALHNRLQGSVEYYRKNAKDLFGNSPVDYTAVADYRLDKNVASIKGTGWDISITSINLKGPFTWVTNLNFNTSKDKVLEYYLPNRQASNFLNGGNAISALEGRPVYAVYAYRWAGLDPLTGDPLGYLNGQPSKDYSSLTGSSFLVDDLAYKGPAFPVIFGSMGNTIGWRNISLTARLAYKFGYYFMRSTVNYSNLFSSRQGHADYALRWQNPGDELNTTVPSMVYPAVSRRDLFYTNAEILVEKADHIRLQYITLSYDFKPGKNKRLPFSALNLYFNMNNIGILWRANKHGIDPDYRDNTILPPKNFAFGLKAQF